MAIADTREVRARTVRRCVWLCLWLAVAAAIPGIWYAGRREYAIRQIRTCHYLDDIRLPCPPMTGDRVDRLAKKLRLNVGFGTNVAIVSFHLGRNPEDWNCDVPEEP